ncbi:hypothetical protein CEP51_004327 [Fusarium floridanum]|uniref:Uncharacterized protein n=1 Tax=Fusarium floridanum TaxID=1325733 RepID=A0A428S1J8_9HYPO|nr:hypothetical protein CEP51_004327 [Fusarium floridanum]
MNRGWVEDQTMYADQVQQLVELLSERIPELKGHIQVNHCQALEGGQNEISMSCIRDGAVRVFQAFLDHGWDINSFNHIPALHLATNSIPLTTWFLEHGADPNLISKDGYTPLDFVAIHPTHDVPVIIDLLLSSGAIPAHSNALHNALIDTYADMNCIAMMMLLLEKGFDINALSFTNRPKVRGRNPSTPLHWAVRKHHTRKGRKNMLARVRWLIDHGADVEVRDSKGKTPIEWASDEALIEVLRGKKASSAPCGNGARRQTVKTWLRRH